MAPIPDRVAAALDRAGIITPERLHETIDLAWPRIITGVALMSKSTVDLVLVGWSVGAAAIAGLAFAQAYWTVAKFAGIGLAGGTVSLVSQNVGGGAADRAGTVLDVSVLLAAIACLPLIVLYTQAAYSLVNLIARDSGAAVEHGATYLAIVAPALGFEFYNLIASRTYAGVGDTFTPMVVRAGGGIVNAGASTVLVFGADLEVTGVALGTVLATGAVSVVLVWGLLGRPYPVPGMAASPVTHRGLGTFDPMLARQLISVSAPLVGRRVVEHLVTFPLLFIAASFGPAVVAAYEIGRRVRALLDSFSWGFSIASSTLVGQELGAGREGSAAEYGWSIVRLSGVIYVVTAVVVVVAAPWIVLLFDPGPEAIDPAVIFVRLAAVSVVFLGIDGSITGTLRGAGDTLWPFYVSLVAQYAVALPLAAIGLVTPLAVTGLYAAFVVAPGTRAALNLYRLRQGDWKRVSRQYRPDAV